MKKLFKKLLLTLAVIFVFGIMSTMTEQQQASAGTQGCIGAQSNCFVLWWRTVDGETEIDVEVYADYENHTFE